MKAYIAEAIGTCILTMILIMVSNTPVVWAVPLFAVSTLIYLAYSFGPVSGAHVNPALTIGALATGKIELNKAIGYIVAQIAGAAAAILLIQSIGDVPQAPPSEFAWRLFFAELGGMFVFGYGVAAVMSKRVHPAATGFVVGLSLFAGIIVSSLLLSGTKFSAILNPAVAYGLNLLSISSVIGATLGAVIGMWAFALLTEDINSVLANMKKVFTRSTSTPSGSQSDGVKIA